jgi:subtilisin family serine protease
VDADGWDLVDGDPDPTEERNGLDDDGDGQRDEGFGHGTFVASLVLAVAPDARILPIRVLDTDCVGHASLLASAITMAADRGAHVINLSAGMATRAKVVEDAIGSARSRGVWVVVASGNTGVEDVHFPAALSNAESVTSVDGQDRRSPFASFGSEVDLAAPGQDLLGAFPEGSGTAWWSGTSFSAALVSGAYALVRERHPEWGGEEVLKHLEDTATAIDALNPSVAGRLGEGRLDLDAATR